MLRLRQGHDGNYSAFTLGINEVLGDLHACFRALILLFPWINKHQLIKNADLDNILLINLLIKYFHAGGPALKD